MKDEMVDQSWEVAMVLELMVEVKFTHPLQTGIH